MKRWKYRIETMACGENIVDRLNMHGEEGWEVFAFKRLTEDLTTIYMKKEKQEDEE